MTIEKIDITSGLQPGPRSARGLMMLDYWRRQAQDKPLPSRSDIDPCDIPPLLANTYLIDVSYDPLDFRYRLLGTGINSRSAADYTGKRVADIAMQAPPSLIWTLFETATTEQRPACAHIPYKDQKNRFVEMLALPLSEDGKNVNMLIGTVIFEREKKLMRNQVLL